MKLLDILRTAHEHKASDIHLISGHPPMMRVNTVMTPMDYPMLTPAGVKQMLEEMINEAKMKRFEEQQDLDFSYGVAELGRYRMQGFSTHRRVPNFDDLTFVPCTLSRVPLEGRLLHHELHHVAQYEVLGPLYLPTYVAVWMFRGYRRHPFETEANVASSGLGSGGVTSPK